ncbi:MAG: oxygenase MpaB family protein [Acidimicrobiia bacterium]
MPENAEMRRVAREGALLAGGARAILLQIAHPAVGRGVAEHSDFAARPLDRLRTTLTYVYCVTFGTPEEIEAVAAAVTTAHRKVTGTGYRATDPELQLWVAATLYDTAMLVYQELFGPLDSTVADKVYGQYAVLGTALQVPAGLWPADRAAFGAYWQHMVDTLEVSDDARRVARDLLDPKHAPLLLKAAMPANRFLTTAWLPEPIRRQYGLPWGNGQQRLYDALMRMSRPVYRLLPVPVREAPKTFYLRDLRKRLAT